MSKLSDPAKSKGWVDYGGVRVDFDGSVSDIFGDKNIKAAMVVATGATQEAMVSMAR